MTSEDRCTVCGGTRGEHYEENGEPKTQHVFATENGRLETPEQQHKRLRGVERGPTRMSGPTMPLGRLTGTDVTRLAEVLAHRGLIDDKDLLYIAGYGPAPWSEAVKS
jgi:hypothetical protein